MDDVLMCYETGGGWDHEKFISDFEKSESSATNNQEPLRLEAGRVPCNTLWVTPMRDMHNMYMYMYMYASELHMCGALHVTYNNIYICTTCTCLASCM